MKAFHGDDEHKHGHVRLLQSSLGCIITVIIITILFIVPKNKLFNSTHVCMQHKI